MCFGHFMLQSPFDESANFTHHTKTKLQRPHCQSPIVFSAGVPNMAASLQLLLLCCICLSVDCQRYPDEEATRKPRTTKTMRLPRADEGAKHSVIDFSDDIDGEPDSSG